jgi:hypothetical protein
MFAVRLVMSLMSSDRHQLRRVSAVAASPRTREPLRHPRREALPNLCLIVPYTAPLLLSIAEPNTESELEVVTHKNRAFCLGPASLPLPPVCHPPNKATNPPSISSTRSSGPSPQS